jgi:uncharacterized protein HemX
MADERPASGLVHIAVAVIGVAGSLGVAWLTTSARFNQELDRSGSDLTELRKSLEEAQAKLARQQREVDQKVADVEQRLKKLDTEVETAKAAVAAVTKSTRWLLGSGKKSTP